VQREQAMLPLKVSSPEMNIGVEADGFAERGQPPRDLSPRRALQQECVVTKEIRSSAPVARRTF